MHTVLIGMITIIIVITEIIINLIIIMLDRFKLNFVSILYQMQCKKETILPVHITMATVLSIVMCLFSIFIHRELGRKKVGTLYPAS